MAIFNPVLLIEEVQKRPSLYRTDCPVDREEKLALWKEIGAAMYPDWNNLSKATVYDRVLQIQKKWRSLRDTYNRELRSRRSGVRAAKRTYIYYKKMKFLGGHEGLASDGELSTTDISNTEMCETIQHDDQSTELVEVDVKRPKKKRKKREPSPESYPTEEVEMPIFPMDLDNSAESDSDKLFFMSFLPELRQLPVHIKMWVRAQVANIMQEAVTCHYNNTRPGTSEQNDINVKRPLND